MSHYRRIRVAGGTYFFTVRLADRRSDLLTHKIDLLRNCVRLCKVRWPFDIDAAVVLPDHLHMIWTLPPGDKDFSKRWRLIKSTFSRHVDAPKTIRPSLQKRGEKGIWQRRFWEHWIRDAADFAAHEAFLHASPVRAGLVAKPMDWKFSSAHYKPITGGAHRFGYGP